MRTLQRVFIALAMCAGVAVAQNYQQAFDHTTTAAVNSVVMRGGSVNQFHQLTVVPYNITGNSCEAGGDWQGEAILQASLDNVTWFQLGFSLTRATTGTGTFTSAAGSFAYIRIRYVSGNTGVCSLSVWYSGTATGYPSANTAVTPVLPVPIAGNEAARSGQQTVTNAAVSLGNSDSKQACVKALTGNSAAVYIGHSAITTSTGMELSPGDAVCLPVANLGLLYVVAAASVGDKVSWVYTN